MTVKKKKVVEKVRGPEFVLDLELMPMPERKPKGATATYFPFDVLEVGRSFTTHRTLGTVRVAIRRFRKEGAMEKEFMAQVQRDSRVRCWRAK